jgi:hypothetical protein
MDWIDLNPDYKSAGKAPSKNTSFTFKSGKRKKSISNKQLRKKVKSKFPTRSGSAVWMGEKTKAGTPRWPVTRESVVNKRAQTEQPTSKWVDIPKGDLAILPSEGKGNADNKKPVMAQKRVFENVGKRGIFWKGAYTGKKILHSSKVDVDHVVPKFRAQASEFMGNKMLETLKQKYKFVRDTKNLVISTQHENREVKKGYGLSKYQPPLKSARPAYAQKYSDVMQDYGMKLTVGEAAKYTEMTGKTLSHERKAHGLWDQKESNRMNTFMETERAKSMRSRNK